MPPHHHHHQHATTTTTNDANTTNTNTNTNSDSSLVASRSAALATHLSASGWWYWSHGMSVLWMTFFLPLSGSSFSLQPVHSFLKLPIPISSEEQSKIGVIAASAGNHALALAWHGKQMGIPVTVLMPTLAPLAKVCYRAFIAQHHPNTAPTPPQHRPNPRSPAVVPSAPTS